jgi:hypothetical protein
MANVMLIALLGKVFAYRTWDPRRVGTFRLAKRGSQICKSVYLQTYQFLYLMSLKQRKHTWVYRDFHKVESK